MTAYEQLEALYATLPKVSCKRKCQGCCGPLLIPEIELRRMEEKTGYIQQDSRQHLETDGPFKNVDKDLLRALTPDDDLTCKQLMPFTGACRVYSVRPMVCRMWGTTPSMRCPFGCVPDRWLTTMEAYEFFAKVLKIQEETRT